jgi:hypothetical protein
LYGPVQGGAETGGFDLKHCAGVAIDGGESIFEGGDGFAATCVERLELVPGVVADQASAVCRAVDRVVMDDDEVSVARALDVELDEIDAEREAGTDGGLRVFRGVARGATVPDSEDAAMIVHDYAFLRMITGLLSKCRRKIFFENQLTL